jgi:hypothetical protein
VFDKTRRKLQQRTQRGQRRKLRKTIGFLLKVEEEEEEEKISQIVID